MDYQGNIITSNPTAPTTTSAQGIWTLSEAIRFIKSGTWPTGICVEDVFNAYTYWGNGATQSITTGVNISGRGGMVWIKGRGYTYVHDLFDTVRDTTNFVQTHSTGAQGSDSNSLTAFSSTGFSLGSWAHVNAAGSGDNGFVAWSFAQAPNFFNVAQATVSGGVTATVDLSNLGTVGMVAVKRTDSTSAWFVYHRSCTSGKLLYFNTTDNETTDGSVTLSGTTLSLVGGTIANGTYIVYAWAHDTSSTGMIQCGTFTTNGSSVGSVTLGWEPQFLLFKEKVTITDNWQIFDMTRGLNNTSLTYLKANSTAVEFTTSAADYLHPTATGFASQNGFLDNNGTYVYLAIRRGPMRLPTVGTQVYNAIARNGTGAAATVTGVGFPPDLSITLARTNGIGAQGDFIDRLRGSGVQLTSAEAHAEYANATAITSFDMDGVTLGTDGLANVNYNTKTFINWYLRRYPGVFDMVCYTGTGSAHVVSHNLGAVPELMIVKTRASTYNWFVYSSATGNTKYMGLNVTDRAEVLSTIWNDTTPTSTGFTIGTNVVVNTNGDAYVAYLFATLAGISKVGSYTGNGSSQTLNMGFSAGARFFMCKRTDDTGDWFVWDSVRGINAGNDPHLSLNTTAAEVNTTDDVDADNSGIIVNENATTHINVNNATYIYLSFS